MWCKLYQKRHPQSSCQALYRYNVRKLNRPVFFGLVYTDGVFRATKKESCAPCKKVKADCSYTYPCVQCASHDRDCRYSYRVSRDLPRSPTTEGSEASETVPDITVKVDEDDRPIPPSTSSCVDDSHPTSSSSPPSCSSTMSSASSSASSSDPMANISNPTTSVTTPGESMDNIFVLSQAVVPVELHRSATPVDGLWMDSPHIIRLGPMRFTSPPQGLDLQTVLDVVPPPSPDDLRTFRECPMSSRFISITLNPRLSVEAFYVVNQAHVPAIHIRTWSITGKPSELILAMHVCGASFVKSRTARKFSRDFMKPAKDKAVRALVSTVLRRTTYYQTKYATTVSADANSKCG